MAKDTGRDVPSSFRNGRDINVKQEKKDVQPDTTRFIRPALAERDKSISDEYRVFKIGKQAGLIYERQLLFSFRPGQLCRHL